MDPIDVVRDDGSDASEDVPETLDIPHVVNTLAIIENATSVPIDEEGNGGNAEMRDLPHARSSLLGSIGSSSDLGTSADRSPEGAIGNLAKQNNVSDDELLQLKHKKQRRSAKSRKSVPSRFCHICNRNSRNMRVAVCDKIKLGTCWKVTCEGCFEEDKLGVFNDAADIQNSVWSCTHCTSTCPARAKCRTHHNIRDHVEENPFKQGSASGHRSSDVDDYDDTTATCQGTQARPLLPATIPASYQLVDITEHATYVGHALAAIPAAAMIRSHETPASANRPRAMPPTLIEIPSSPCTPTRQIKEQPSAVVVDASLDITAEIGNEVAPTVHLDASIAIDESSPIGSDDMNMDMDVIDHTIDMTMMSDEFHDLVCSITGAEQTEGPKQQGTELQQHDLEDF